MTTLADLRTAIRQRADMESSDFVSDAELTRAVNNSSIELYDLCLSAYGDDYLSNSVTFSTTAGTRQYDWATIFAASPTSLYKVLRVAIQFDDTETPLLNYSLGDQIATLSGYSWQGRTPRYRVHHRGIAFDPAPDTAYTIAVYYVPQVAELSADSDVFTLWPYEEYVILDVAIKLLTKEESDVSALLAEKAQIAQRIQNAAPPFDAGEAPHIVDARSLSGRSIDPRVDELFWWH